MTKQKLDKHVGEAVPINSQAPAQSQERNPKEPRQTGGNTTPLLKPLETLKGAEPKSGRVRREKRPTQSPKNPNSKARNG